jgi:hypothetical protein
MPAEWRKLRRYAPYSEERTIEERRSVETRTPAAAH